MSAENAMDCGSERFQDRVNSRKVTRWLALWAVLFLAGTAALRHGLVEAPALCWLLALLPYIPATLALQAFLRYLREADELQRAIQLQALAFAFGCSFLLIGGYPLLERVGAPTLGADGLVVLLAILYAGGRWGIARRYQ